MQNNIAGAIGLSLLLLLGSTPAAVSAHEGHEHGEGWSDEREREDVRRYDPRYDEGRWEDEDRDEDAYRRSPRRSAPPAGEYSAPRERRDSPRW
jgi:hypothetical protein